jgi:hypothetical protein
VIGERGITFRRQRSVRFARALIPTAILIWTMPQRGGFETEQAHPAQSAGPQGTQHHHLIRTGSTGVSWRPDRGAGNGKVAQIGPHPPAHQRARVYRPLVHPDKMEREAAKDKIWSIKEQEFKES